jgi:putative hemolysin
MPRLYLVLAICLIGACSSSSKPPMLVLQYENEMEYNEALSQASDYCLENFGNNAHTTDKWTGVAGTATFSCAP